MLCPLSSFIQPIPIIGRTFKIKIQKYRRPSTPFDIHVRYSFDIRTLVWKADTMEIPINASVNMQEIFRFL